MASNPFIRNIWKNTHHYLLSFTLKSFIDIIKSPSKRRLKSEVKHMPSISDIVKDSVVEFSRLQNWMLSAKENNDISTYNMMLDRYKELKVILAVAGVNLQEIDKIKE